MGLAKGAGECHVSSYAGGGEVSDGRGGTGGEATAGEGPLKSVCHAMTSPLAKKQWLIKRLCTISREAISEKDKPRPLWSLPCLLDTKRLVVKRSGSKVPPYQSGSFAC